MLKFSKYNLIYIVIFLVSTSIITSTTFAAGLTTIDTSTTKQSFDSKVIWPVPVPITRKMKGASWHKKYKCPNFDTLSYVKLSYWGFDNKKHQGVLVIAHALSTQVVTIFKVLYQHHFPIQSMKPMYLFKGDDELSMEANNTSSFNCRPVTDRPNELSQHSYGRAIDINPRTNPYVKNDLILPNNANKTSINDKDITGVIVRNNFIYNLFKSRGWYWGGDWCDLQDYQHFEKRANHQVRPSHCREIYESLMKKVSRSEDSAN